MVPGTADEPLDEVDRRRAAARIRDALDENVLGLEEAGRRLSEVLRAPSRARLDRLTRDLDPGDEPVDDGLDHATLLCAGLRILLFAALTALLLTVLMHGVEPMDRF
ncbi:hypothetical protein ACFQH9_26425 [Pseudonocardia lutea]|jgi:hypothetical protein|uniref:Uncharacterized protein n=1 Tax=Pseudonocardia lutea TaxID=2172015 RepID=A0ABW1IDV4_9PSEU